MQSTLQRKMLMKEAKLEDFERVPRFGTPAYVERLKAAGGPLHVIRPITNDLEMANNSYKKKFGEITAEAKADILRKKDQVFQEMVSVPPPHTFIFDGHGLDDTFFLGSGGDRKKGNAPATDAGALHYKYFAKALRNRYEKFKTQSPLLQKDVFIFESCYSTNLTMNTDAALKGTDYRPIFIATNEYGQVGFTDLEQATGSKFSANVLGLKEAKKQTITLGDIMRRQDEGDSNVSIFIPRKDKPIEETILEQITQLPEKEKGNTDTPERKAA